MVIERDEAGAVAVSQPGALAFTTAQKQALPVQIQNVPAGQNQPAEKRFHGPTLNADLSPTSRN